MATGGARLTNAETHLVLKAGSGVEVENVRRLGARWRFTLGDRPNLRDGGMLSELRGSRENWPQLSNKEFCTQARLGGSSGTVGLEFWCLRTFLTLPWYVSRRVSPFM